MQVVLIFVSMQWSGPFLSSKVYSFQTKKRNANQIWNNGFLLTLQYQISLWWSKNTHGRNIDWMEVENHRGSLELYQWRYNADWASFVRQTHQIQQCDWQPSAWSDLPPLFSRLIMLYVADLGDVKRRSSWTVGIGQIHNSDRLPRRRKASIAGVYVKKKVYRSTNNMRKSVRTVQVCNDSNLKITWREF